MLLTNERVRHVRRDWEAQNQCILHGVELPRTAFDAPAEGANILLRRADSGKGCCVLIEEGVAYLGTDAGLSGSFAGQTHRGWRVLCSISPAEPAIVLGRLEAILGLGNSAPSLSTAEEGRCLRQHNTAETPPAFGVDLVEEARQGLLAPALFRERESDALIRVITKQGKNAAVLVGEAGVGKTKVIEHLACRIAEGRTPDSLRDVRILDVNLSFLAAGASAINEFEGRLKRILDAARDDRSTILFFDELHLIASPVHQAAQLVKADLGRGRIRCIGATTPFEFRVVEEDAALARRFQTVPVLELSGEQTLQILASYAVKLGAYHTVTIPPELLCRVVELSRRYLPQRRLPDKAIDLLDEACALARIAADGASGELE